MANVKTYYKSNNVKLSEHFKVSEFACKDGTNKLLLDMDLIPVLERFREYVEAGVTINSAYRTSSYNKKVGGASNSYHLYGRALDIPFKGSYKYLTNVNKMCAFFNSLGLKGIIKYGTFVHIDTRPNKYHATNTGVAQSYGKVNIPFRKTLSKGSKGVDVGVVQFKLNSLGYNCGNADMTFGANTETAVRTFQKAKGLKVDGIVGSATWNKLFN